MRGQLKTVRKSIVEEGNWTRNVGGGNVHSGLTNVLQVDNYSSWFTVRYGFLITGCRESCMPLMIRCRSIRFLRGFFWIWKFFE